MAAARHQEDAAQASRVCIKFFAFTILRDREVSVTFSVYSWSLRLSGFSCVLDSELSEELSLKEAK